MTCHGSVFALEVLEVSTALGAARNAVRDKTLEVLAKAVRAALGQSIAADLANLAAVAGLASARV